jgi:hypothetical protein
LIIPREDRPFVLRALPQIWLRGIASDVAQSLARAPSTQTRGFPRGFPHSPPSCPTRRVCDGSAEGFPEGVRREACAGRLLTGDVIRLPVTITIRFPLLPKLSAQLPGPDMHLERRIWLADRIRETASTKTLGPLFAFVEMISSERAAGPSEAVFTFDAADTAAYRRKVATFVRGLIDFT